MVEGVVQVLDPLQIRILVPQRLPRLLPLLLRPHQSVIAVEVMKNISTLWRDLQRAAFVSLHSLESPLFPRPRYSSFGPNQAFVT